MPAHAIPTADTPREKFRHFMSIATRWMDNDVYGHVNNVNYYSYFDTAVNHFLIENGVLDFQRDNVVGLVVDTGCAYFSSIAFPDLLTIGIAVVKLGRSSVRYDVGLFANDKRQVSAAGHFVHVYVDRASGLPTPIPDGVRRLLETIAVESAATQ